MIKSIFVGNVKEKEIISSLSKLNINHIIIEQNNLTVSLRNFLEVKKITIGLWIAAFTREIPYCPANPTDRENVIQIIKNISKLKINEIWLDHFRFEGRWEVNGKIINTHQPCKYCKKKNRIEVLVQLTKDIKRIIKNKKIQLGYFAVPYTTHNKQTVKNKLGQNHKELMKYFDIISPMVYHRMLGEQPRFIHKTVNYISSLTDKPILPIIQIKDMPDDLKDTITRNDIKTFYTQAIKKPSSGNCFFLLDHALETNKLDILINCYNIKHDRNNRK